MLLAAGVVAGAVADLFGVDFTLVDRLRQLIDPAAPTPDREIYGQVPKIVVDLVVSAIIVGLLWVVAGPRAVGLHRRVPGESVLAVGAAVRGPYLMALIWGLVEGLLLDVAVSHDAATDSGYLPWLMVLILANAGITEEITTTVLPYFLLEQIRTRSGTPVAHTGIGTALIVGLWWVLHLDSAGPLPLGLAVVFYLKLMVWRRSKHLPVLIALHVGWNLWVYLTAAVVPDEYALPIYCGGLVVVGLVARWESRVVFPGVLPAEGGHRDGR